MLDYRKDILLVTERQEDLEIARRYLVRIGFDRIRGIYVKALQTGIIAGCSEQSGAMMAGDERLKKDTFVLDVQ
jgi:hypothetical protein